MEQDNRLINTVLTEIDSSKITEHTMQRAAWMARWIFGIDSLQPIIDTDISDKEAAKVCRLIRVGIQDDNITQELQDRLAKIEYQSRNPNSITKT